MTALVVNATDFSRSEVRVTAHFDPHHISLEVRDDGHGFTADILAKLGARDRVHAAKVALGERGTPWWIEPRS